MLPFVAEEMDIFSPDEREKILAEVYSLSVGSEGDVDSSLEGNVCRSISFVVQSSRVHEQHINIHNITSSIQ